MRGRGKRKIYKKEKGEGEQKRKSRYMSLLEELKTAKMDKKNFKNCIEKLSEENVKKFEKRC